MQVDKNILIGELEKATREIIYRADKFSNLANDDLNWRRSADSWSILECIEHLNLYGDYYLPAIRLGISEAKHNIPSAVFSSGVIGNYMANSMKPGEKMRKMKTVKDKNPIHSKLTIAVLERFKKQQLELLDLLELARTADLTKTKIPISLTKFLKLRLGDVLRFTVHHNQRHILQAEEIAASLQKAVRG